MADGPQSEAPSSSFLRALTIYTVPADLRHGGEFGRLVCVDGFEPHLVHGVGDLVESFGVLLQFFLSNFCTIFPQ